MPDSKEPMQTTPTGGEREAAGLRGTGGTKVPVPKRADVLDALRKVAKPRRKRSAERDGGSKE